MGNWGRMYVLCKFVGDPPVQLAWSGTYVGTYLGTFL